MQATKFKKRKDFKMKFESKLLNNHVNRKNIIIEKNRIILQPYDTDLEKEEKSIIKELKKEKFEHDVVINLFNLNVDGLMETNKNLIDTSIAIYDYFGNLLELM